MALSTQEVATGKQEERERLVLEIEKKLGIAADHPGDELYLCSSPIYIVSNLKNRKEGWTVRRVMEAYIRKTCATHRETNCLTEIMFEEALQKAEEMDQALEAGQRVTGDFWGLPSSFKDTYNIVGVDSSIGCSSHCFHSVTSPDSEAGIVKVFRKAGGIPFCKTNVPQTLFAFECSNPIFGVTNNPLDPSRTSGGSSGGESALVFQRGTPIGWGSDIGGSLRIPAHYSGVCALKPVKGRWPISGQRHSVEGFEALDVVVGPITRNVDDLIFASKVILDTAGTMSSEELGENLHTTMWRKVDLPAKFKIGYIVEIGGVKTSPACARAVRETAKCLQAAGHHAVPFEVPETLFVEAFRVMVALTSADGYRTMLSNIGKDPMEASLQLVTLGSKLPAVVHRLATFVLRNVLKDELFAKVFGDSRPRSVRDFWKATAERDALTETFNKLAWKENQFDAIICPVQAVPALRHNETKFLSPLAIATIIFNIIDSTVGVLPVTNVDRVIDKTPADLLDGSKGSWILENRVYKGSDPAYDAERMHGLPVGIQVVGKTWEEEKVLGVMKVIESSIAFTTTG